MALVRCRECGSEVSESAARCPRCGIGNPGGQSGTLIIKRLLRFGGAATKVEVAVDGQPKGILKNGHEMTLVLAPGHYRIDARNWLHERSANVRIFAGQTTAYKVWLTGNGMGFEVA